MNPMPIGSVAYNIGGFNGPEGVVNVDPPSDEFLEASACTQEAHGNTHFRATHPEFLVYRLGDGKNRTRSIDLNPPGKPLDIDVSREPTSTPKVEENRRMALVEILLKGSLFMICSPCVECSKSQTEISSEECWHPRLNGASITHNSTLLERWD